MRLTLLRRIRVVALPGLLACAGAPPSPPSPPSPSSPPFQISILPFPVFDSAGQPLELAFLGGFNAPRPQLVDADGDGDRDLFVQEVTGSVALFLRVGEQGGIPRFQYSAGRYAGLDIGEWFRFADVDQDGDLDLLAEQPYSYIKYFRNTSGSSRRDSAPRLVLAADTLRDTEGRPIFSDRQNIPQLGDLDCNRRSDLLIGRLDGTVARYEAEPGTGAVPAFRLLSNEFEGIRIIGQQGPPGQLVPGTFTPGPSMHGANTMALTDHDSDGDLDLFWGDFFEPGLLLIPNTGSCRAPSFKGQPAQFPLGDPILTSGYNAPSFGEIDGTGTLELVMGVLGGAYNPLRTSAENLYYLRRDPSGRWSLRTRRLLPVVDVGSETIPSIGDVDGDKDLDILLANKIDPADLKSSRVYLLENIGGVAEPRFRLRQHLPLPSRYHYAPALADLDADGAADLVLGQWGPTLAWYRWTGAGLQAVDTSLVTITRGSNTVSALGDLDADGDLDLMVGESSGWLNYYENSGSRSRPQFTLVSDEFQGLKVGRRSAPALVDLDRDGDLDLLVGSELDGLTLFRNTGTRAQPRFRRDSLPLPDIPALAAPASGDLDGDGDLDVLLGNVGGGVVYLEQR